MNARDPRCPFCGHEVAPLPPSGTSLVGRVSRAAVFAGTALATSCDQGAPPGQLPQVLKVAPRVGTITGSATWFGVNAFGSHTGAIAAGTAVILKAEDGTPRASVKVDDQGGFLFDKVPVGTYTLELDNSAPDLQPSRQEVVTVHVHEGTVETATIQMHVAMPYGSPPRRRRVV